MCKVLLFWERCRSYFAEFSGIGRFRVGQGLLDQITLLETLKFQNKKLEVSDTPYKYFLPLLHQVLDLGRKFGVPVNSGLKEIKKNLIKDLKFEQKLSAELWGGFIQFLMVSAITWLFSFFTKKIAGVNFPGSVLLFIGLMQIAGAVFFHKIYHILYRQVFKYFEEYLLGVLTLKSLVVSQQSVGESLKLAKINNLQQIENKQFRLLNQRLKVLITDWQKAGIPIKVQLDEILEEIWFLQEELFLQFLKKVAALKFLVLALFYLSSFLLLIGSLFTMLGV
jgi:hypothetical protein